MFWFLFFNNLLGTLFIHWALFFLFSFVLNFISPNYQHKANWSYQVAEFFLYVPISYIILVPLILYFYKNYLKEHLLISFGVPWLIPLATLFFLVISFIAHENDAREQSKQAISANVYADQAAMGLSGNTPNIHMAVEQGIEQVKLAIQAGADINYIWNDRTALYGEIQSNKWEMATLLLELGADTEFRPNGGLRHDTAAELFCSYMVGTDDIKKIEISPTARQAIRTLIAAFEKRGVMLSCADEINRI